MIVRGFEKRGGDHAFRCASAHFRRAKRRVPKWQQDQRNEAAIAFSGAPFPDHPVVIGLDAGQPQLLVRLMQVELARKT